MENDNVSALLALMGGNGEGGNGEGGGGSSDAVLYTQQTLTPAQQAQARQNIQGEAASKVVQISGPDAVITPEDNTIYQCGELTSLTITNPPAVGIWTVVFSVGSSPTQSSIPASIIGMEGFAASPYSLYEFCVVNRRALYHGWPMVIPEEAE